MESVKSAAKNYGITIQDRKYGRLSIPQARTHSLSLGFGAPRAIPAYASDTAKLHDHEGPGGWRYEGKFNELNIRQKKTSAPSPKSLQDGFGVQQRHRQNGSYEFRRPVQELAKSSPRYHRNYTCYIILGCENFTRLLAQTWTHV